MVLGAGLVLFSFISNCPEDAKNLGVNTKAIVRVSGTAEGLAARQGIPSADLMRIFDLPQSLDGDVAHLHAQKDLHIFGIVHFEKSGFEFIQIYGFDEFPMPVAVIFVDGHKPTNREPLHFPMGQEVAYAAIRNHPKLLDFMKSKGAFNFTPAQEANAIQSAKVLVHETFFEAEKKDVSPRTWPQVRRDVLRQEHERRAQWRGYEELKGEGKLPPNLSKTAKEATVPNPPNREESRTVFGGYLPQDGYAVAALNYVLRGKEQGLFVYLNPSHKKPHHESFASLPERIGIEGRFRIDWLKLEKPIVIEIDGATDLRQMYLVFEGEHDLPKGIPFFRIDVETGQRLSEKPVTLARRLEPTDDTTSQL